MCIRDSLAAAERGVADLKSAFCRAGPQPAAGRALSADAGRRTTAPSAGGTAQRHAAGRNDGRLHSRGFSVLFHQ